MNINELNRIKTVNIEEKLAGVERGTGTFKEILDNVMAEVIIPLIDNPGTIVGISFDTKVDNVIDDCIEQRKFEMRYCCKPIMKWVLKALEIKAAGKAVAEVIENEDGIKVVTETGEVIDIETYDRPSVESAASKVELPSEVEITYEEADEASIEECPEEEQLVLAYLRNKYNHYLSGKHEAPTIEFDDENCVIKVTNIHWGRKR